MMNSFWDMFIFLWIIWQAIFIPFYLCFDINYTGALTNLETAIDALFWTDILIAFNTGFYKNGILVMNRKLVVIHYIKTWFLLDLVATFPYNYLINGDDT